MVDNPDSCRLLVLCTSGCMHVSNNSEDFSFLDLHYPVLLGCISCIQRCLLSVACLSVMRATIRQMAAQCGCSYITVVVSTSHSVRRV